jgi:monoamine oxidase
MKNILQRRRSSKTTHLVSSVSRPNRRDVLTAGAFLLNPCLSWCVAATARPKRVIVAGAGLAGLSCAWELSKRGHDVTVLEASNRTGGHVRTIREGFPDHLYADCGAEHFTYPGYELCYQYAKEFGLTLLPYPHRDNQMVLIDGRMISEDDAARVRLSRAQYSPKERRFMQSHPGASLTTSRPCDSALRFRCLERLRPTYRMPTSMAFAGANRDLSLVIRSRRFAERSSFEVLHQHEVTSGLV